MFFGAVVEAYFGAGATRKFYLCNCEWQVTPAQATPLDLTSYPLQGRGRKPFSFGEGLG